MLTTKDLILRDITEEDLARHLYWETVETEWQLWDGHTTAKCRLT